MVKSIGPDHEIATLMRAPLVSEPCPRVASSPARGAPADAPNAPIFFGSMRNEAAWPGLAHQGVGGAPVSARRGIRVLGREPVVQREDDEAELREQTASSTNDVLSPTAHPPPCSST